MNIGTLGEFELIKRLTAHLPGRADVLLGVGDDCAVLDLQSEALLLTTCDSQVEGVHFTLQTSSPEQIGRKALAINLSDIAAMGGEPRYALISLILPPALPLSVLEGIYAGLRAEATRFNTALVGGNVAGTGQAAQLIIDITLLGTVERGHVLMRSGAQVGDILFVTGTPGDSAAGFYTLLHPDPAYPARAQEVVRQRHRTPNPRVHEGRILSQLGTNVVTAMLDISDGLSGDLEHLCTRSQVGALIEAERLPLSPALRAIAAHTLRDPLDWALHGGEDYELLFTVAPGSEQLVSEAVQSATGTPVTPIGVILPAPDGMKVRYSNQREERLASKSWDHLKASLERPAAEK
ncbi:thiamine-phosphate kinase [Ktedonosporobacter rubrisoli]|uniref:thiamine-phosphate kinase n=1 Tax=Ktedonosporobacter rubrisoli TaxID=2509675 RepID=UPI0013EE7B12|nr:thiamine-phosphate kinase [Ktedonosporobacter rubrisoli]